MWEVLDVVNTFIVNATDYIFGWILYLNRDVALFTVAILTSACLTFIRKWTTDQNWLTRADADARRLGQLIKEARKTRDKEAVRRHKDTITTIKVKSMKFEGKPLLWALLPIGLLATWAFGRLAFVPPRVDETVDVKMYLPKTAVGQYVHIAPEDGIEAVGGWVQPVVDDAWPKPANIWDKYNMMSYHYVFNKLGALPQPEGVAVWKLIAKDSRIHTLKIRYNGRTYEKEFFAGRRQYPVSFSTYTDTTVQGVEVAMKPLKLFDWVGALDVLWLQPWIVAYLLIAIPFVSILKKVFKIY
ncbi:MAG: hypothetical protein C0404_09005 [Verrucomicrobia bacterium]|nr:hypothetical protein [Verrucomicrobiota bacterium]